MRGYSTSFTPGAYSIVAEYSGDSLNQASSSAALLETVNASGAAASTITFTSSPSAPIVGNPLTLSAAVSGKGGTPTGTVYFLDGSNVVGSAQIGSDGSASTTNSSLSVGVHNLTAFYGGDGNYAPVTSSVDTVQVYAVPVGDYAIAATATQLNLSGNLTQTYISVVTSGGFNQPITFSCSGLPAGYNCAFTPASITPTGTGIQSTQLSIVGQNSSSLNQPRSLRGFAMALAGICFLGLPFCWRFRRKWVGMIGILVVAVCFGTAISGCTSSASSKTYTVTVTGTSLPLSHSITIQLQK